MTVVRRCQCINITHRTSRCKKDATKKCTTCYDLLCNGCANQHHAHDTIVDIDAPDRLGSS